jgi:hypothetical protein
MKRSRELLSYVAKKILLNKISSDWFYLRTSPYVDPIYFLFAVYLTTVSVAQTT